MLLIIAKANCRLLTSEDMQRHDEINYLKNGWIPIQKKTIQNAAVNCARMEIEKPPREWGGAKAAPRNTWLSWFGRATVRE